MENTEQKYHYDAFISYRHNERDSTIAQTLMHLLESHPSRDGKRKIHLFRDKDEFPTSSNLSESIHSALRESRFLILICSFEYLKSEWCMEEVRYFRSLHGNTNQGILPILVDGEPQETFPEELFHETLEILLSNGEIHREIRNVEPLAADIRADSLNASLKKLKDTEYIRILAPILDVRFDDLYQREKRQQRKRFLLIVYATIAIGSLFICFLLWQLFQVRQSQLHEDLVYAEQLLQEGNRTKALKKSESIISGYWQMMDKQILKRADELQFLSSLPIPLSVKNHIAPQYGDNSVFFSLDGKSIMNLSTANLQLYDLNGNLERTFSLENKGQKLAAVSPDGTRIVILKLLRNGEKALELWDIQEEKSLGILQTSAVLEDVDGLRAVFSPDGKTISAFCTGGSYNENETLCLFSSETGKAICELDGYLAGSFEKDGVQDRIVSDFEFLNSNVAHWRGSGNHVFYNIEESKTITLPLRLAKAYAKSFSSDQAPLLGRFGVVSLGNAAQVLDLSDETVRSGLDALAAEGAVPVNCQIFNGCYAVGIETQQVIKQDLLFSEPEKRTILEHIFLCNLLTGTIYTPSQMDSWQCENPRILTASGSSICCIHFIDQNDQEYLLRLSAEDGSSILGQIPFHTSDISYLGRENKRDYFAAQTDAGTELLCYTGEELEAALLLDESLSQLMGNISLTTTDTGISMLAPYRKDFCLFKMESEAKRLDCNGEGSRQISVSEDGTHWIQIWDSGLSLSGKNVPECPISPSDIVFSQAGNNGAAIAASYRQIVVFAEDGSICFETDAGEIISAKLAPNGSAAFWLTLDTVLTHGSDERSGTLHSFDLNRKQETTYHSKVYYSPDRPPEDIYDCSPDGTHVAILAATQIPQLRMLETNNPLDLLRASESPFDALDIPVKAKLSGVRFANSSQLLCTNGNSVAIVNAHTLEGISGITEMSAFEKMPELTKDGILLYFGKNIDFWDLKTGRILTAIPCSSKSSICFSADGKWFALTNADGTALYHSQTYQFEQQLSSLQMEVCRISKDEIVYHDQTGLHRIIIH